MVGALLNVVDQLHSVYFSSFVVTGLYHLAEGTIAYSLDDLIVLSDWTPKFFH